MATVRSKIALLQISSKFAHRSQAAALVRIDSRLVLSISSRSLYFVRQAHSPPHRLTNRQMGPPAPLLTMSRARKGASFNLNWNHLHSNWRQLLSLTNLIRPMSRTDRSHVSSHPRISSHPPTILAQPGQAGRTGTPGTCLDATSTI